MSQEDTSSSVGPMLLTFVAGVAVGAVIAALVTPKSGPELREDLKDAAARAKRKAADVAREAAEALDDLKERGRLAATDLKRGLADSVAHLKQPARERASRPNGAPAGGMGWEESTGGE
ncbi:MAG: YtxH domain-containing protein [Holophaga sp.]|nr:YtxH domain-containing protein [Holophaga sp.]